MSIVEMECPAPAPPGIIIPRVLVVEDDRKMRAILTQQIRGLGFEPVEAKSGFEAIRLAGVMRPELILLDGLLPEMHGFEVSRMIRHLDASYQPHIVLMTSIYKSIRYHNEAKLKYGVDEYLIKPLADHELFRLLERQKVPA